MGLSKLDIDLGKDALSVGGGTEGGEVGAYGFHQLHVQGAAGLRQRALQHVVGVRILHMQRLRFSGRRG